MDKVMLIKRITASALALLIFATLLVGLLPASASTVADKYDYSLSGATVRTVSAAEILESYLSGSLTAAERDYQSYKYYHLGPVTGEVVGNLVALLLVGAAFIALGTFISALTENQLAAAVITISAIVVMLGLGLVNSLINVYWLRAVLSWISVYSRFGNFQNGLFDFAAILYYISIAGLFVFLTVRVYEKRRWG